jgi:hypothetical protein
MAARILKLSPQQFRRTLWDHGLPEAEDHFLIWLETVLGRQVTEREYLAAQRQGDKRSDRNRRHYQKRAASQWVAA